MKSLDLKMYIFQATSLIITMQFMIIYHITLNRVPLIFAGLCICLLVIAEIYIQRRKKEWRKA